jgi:glycine/D-amino acid oxidase-like deaminating enzyme
VSTAIVVGAGVFGAALADALAGDGWQVTLVEQFEPGDVRAESGGETRLIRCSHGADELYTRSARRAWELWHELDPRLVVDSGVAWFAGRPDGWEAEGERTLRRLGIPVERLAPDDGARLYPDLAVDDLEFVLLEPEAGVLRAADATRALAARARERGARLVTGTAEPAGAAVRVAAELLEADAVVWACGAWLAQLFPDVVQMRVTLQGAPLFDVPPEWSAARVPAWVDFDAGLYGHSLIEGHGFKSASDVDGPEVDPATRPADAPAEAVREAREYLGRRFPAIAGAPVRAARSCHYSATPDANFIFAPHPEREGVWLCGGGSGHGFKHGPAIAEHAAAVLAGRRDPEPRFALGERLPGGSFRTAGWRRQQR